MASMATEPVDIDSDLLRSVRETVGADRTSEFVGEAVRNELQRHELGVLLAELAAEAGPVPEDLAKEAEAFWRAG